MRLGTRRGRLRGGRLVPRPACADRFLSVSKRPAGGHEVELYLLPSDESADEWELYRNGEKFGRVKFPPAGEAQVEFDGKQLRLDAVDKSTLVLWDDCSGTALAWYLRSRRPWRATVQLAESEDDLTVAAGPIKRQLLSSAGIPVATLESSDHALLDRPQSHATSRLAPLNESLTVAITLQSPCCSWTSSTGLHRSGDQSTTSRPLGASGSGTRFSAARATAPAPATDR